MKYKLDVSGKVIKLIPTTEEDKEALASLMRKLSDIYGHRNYSLKYHSMTFEPSPRERRRVGSLDFKLVEEDSQSKHRVFL